MEVSYEKYVRMITISTYTGASLRVVKQRNEKMREIQRVKKSSYDINSNSRY